MLIAFEGIDGCGKDTQLELLAEDLRSKGIKVATISNIIANTPTGNLIRSVLDPTTAMYINELQVASLFLAELHNVNKWIDGLYSCDTEVILCSRWWFSTLAYAGYKSEEDFRSIFGMCRYKHTPDITFYLSVTPETSIGRINARNGKKEVYDRLDKQKVIRKVYTRLSENKNSEFPVLTTIDGEDSISNISHKIKNIVYEVMSLLKHPGYEKIPNGLNEFKNYDALLSFFNTHKILAAKRHEIITRVTNYSKCEKGEPIININVIDVNTIIFSIEDKHRILSLAKLSYMGPGSKPLKLAREKVSDNLLLFMSNLKRDSHA